MGEHDIPVRQENQAASPVRLSQHMAEMHLAPASVDSGRRLLMSRASGKDARVGIRKERGRATEGSGSIDSNRPRLSLTPPTQGHEIRASAYADRRGTVVRTEYDSSPESVIVLPMRHSSDYEDLKVWKENRGNQKLQDAEVALADAFDTSFDPSQHFFSASAFAKHIEKSHSQDGASEASSQDFSMVLSLWTYESYAQLVERCAGVVKRYTNGWPLFVRAKVGWNPATFGDIVKIPMAQDNRLQARIPEFYLRPRRLVTASGIETTDEYWYSEHNYPLAQLYKEHAASTSNSAQVYQGMPDANKSDQTLITDLTHDAAKIWSSADETASVSSSSTAHMILSQAKTQQAVSPLPVAEPSEPREGIGGEAISLNRQIPSLSHSAPRTRTFIPMRTAPQRPHVSMLQNRDALRSGSDTNIDLPNKHAAWNPLSNFNTSVTPDISNKNASHRTISSAQAHTSSGVDFGAQQEQADVLDSRAFTVLKNPLHQSFVQIPVESFDERLSFIGRRSDFLKKNIVNQFQEDLYKQSKDFFHAQRFTAAEQCMQCVTLVQMCRSLKGAKLQRLLQKLRDQQSSEKARYEELVNNLRTAIRQSISEMRSLKEAPVREPNQTPRPSRREALQEKDQWDRIIDFSLGSPTNLTARFAFPRSSAVDPSLSSHPQVRQLSSKYKTRRGQKFFQRGKVFAVLWHESVGQSKARLTDSFHEQVKHEAINAHIARGPYGEEIFAQIRRMIVIRNRRGYCWCVSMGTYGGRGLLKKGLSKDDTNAHTIAYDVRRQSVLLPNEPKPMKRPIAIKLSSEHESLDPATRIHLGRPYNVEWNLKVMEIGQVIPDDIGTLMAYVKEELLGSSGDSN